MQIKAEEISQIIKGQLKDYESKIDLSETGTVLSVGDGIARVHGVENCMAMELLEFPGGIMGLALNLEEDNVGCVVLGDVVGIKEGDIVKRTGKIGHRVTRLIKSGNFFCIGELRQCSKILIKAIGLLHILIIETR